MPKIITVYEDPDELFQHSKEKALHLVIMANNLEISADEQNVRIDFNSVKIGRLIERVFSDAGIVLKVNPGTRKA